MPRDALLRVAGVSKSYGTVRALSGVSAEFRGGEIHAVLGENGAGKSTLMGVLAGFVRPDAGEAILDGVPLPLGDPQAVRARGIAMVHQHFMLVDDFTVAENLALARLERLGGPLDVDRLAEPSLDRASSLGWPVDPRARTGDLPVGAQQRVEILKALGGDARVLILDEPTAVLSPDEVDDLFGVLRGLRDQGAAVILIAHKLAEVFQVADRLTVLRGGVKVAEAPLGETTQEEVARWMVGEPHDEPPPPPLEAGPPRITLHGLRVAGDRGEEAVRGVDLVVHAGEIVGVGGVDGNGQVELAEAVAGVRSPSEGSVDADGPVGYIPQDRQGDGLALAMSLRDNFLIGRTDRPGLAWGPILLGRAVSRWAAALVARFSIKVGSLSDPAESLSGGNQQKLVVGRVLDSNPRVLVAANPTRGLDIRAADFVHDRLREAAANGAAVLLISTDRDELAVLAHRTLYMSSGRLRTDAGALVGAAE